MSQTDSNNILKQNAEQRFHYLVNEVATEGLIWVLTDEYGCVMLNTDEEDCLPIWPSQQFAQAWATDEWENCQAESIALDVWKKKWTTGLIDDDLLLVIFPNDEQEGYIFEPQEFEDAVLKKQAKLSRS